MANERRESKRFTIQLNKITGAEVTLRGGSPTPCYVYVADISEGGLRITSDTWFDREQRFGLHLQLNPPLGGEVEVVWNKQLQGGTNVYGLKFVDVNEELQKQIDDFIHSFSFEARRDAVSARLNRVICMQLPEVAQDQRLYVFTSMLSVQGMQITVEMPLEVDQTYDFLLFLEVEEPPVVVRAKAVSLKPATFDRFKVDLVFEGLDEYGVNRINAFLDKVVTGDIDRQPIQSME